METHGLQYGHSLILHLQFLRESFQMTQIVHIGVVRQHRVYKACKAYRVYKVYRAYRVYRVYRAFKELD